MTNFADKELAVTRSYCQKVLAKIDKLVRENFFDIKVANEVWPKALKEQRDSIIASEDLIEFSQRVNTLISVLNTSHCGLYTLNDETFYFLRSLFGTMGAKLKQPAYDFTGLGIGGVKCLPNQVRYVLDGSPAAQAGFMVGDVIAKVNSRPYFGHINFLGTAGTAISLAVKRGSQSLTLYLTPAFKTPRDGYIEAIVKSAREIQITDCKLGYVRLWSGIADSAQVFQSIVYQSFGDVDGLIIDLRDGYGALGTDAVDWLYRPASGIHKITNRFQGQDWLTWRELYDQPAIAIINGGARSGKELVALQLKKTQRALLLGERTAGAMVGGRHYPIDRRVSLYLAVVDTLIDGERIEGVGVAPDISVPFDYNKPGFDSQLDAAVEILRGKISRNKHK